MASINAQLKLFFELREDEKNATRYDDREAQAQAYAALSSGHFDVVNSELARFRDITQSGRSAWLILIQTVGWFFTGFPLAAWCSWRMIPLSDRVVELIGYGGMSADQCYDRQSILRHRGRYDEAKKCIRAGLSKLTETARIRGLFYIDLAEIYRHDGDRRCMESAVDKAIICAEAISKTHPLRAAHIYRSCAKVFSQADPPQINREDRLKRKAQDVEEWAVKFDRYS